MKKKQKKKPWTRKRHAVVTTIGYALLRPYCRWKYGITVTPFKEQGDRAYLVLFNHQTPFDQFFVGMAFRGPIYFVATEDIFSKGWVSSIIRYLVAPIPIKKQATDVAAVMNCIRVAREGGTIALAPEGNRTYSGKTEYMNPAIAGLARRLKLPIALYRIEGGYGIQPRWSDGIRKGKMKGYVAEVIEPEEAAAMDDAALLERIHTGLMVNEAAATGSFCSDKRAEYLERAIYVCPFCGLSTFESSGNDISCKSCGCTVHYGEDKRLTGKTGEFPFAFVNDWYEYQKDYINRLDSMAHTQTPLYREKADVSEVILCKRKQQLFEGAEIALYGDRVVVQEGTGQELVFPFAEVTAASVLGRNKLNLYHDGRVFQFRSGKRFNALKYVQLYYRYNNSIRGNNDDQFLGL